MNKKLLEKIEELRDICDGIVDTVLDNMYDLSIAMDCYHVVVVYRFKPESNEQGSICVNDVFEVDKSNDELMYKIGRFEVAYDENMGYRYDAYVAAPSEDVARSIAYTAFNDYNTNNDIDIYIDSDKDVDESKDTNKSDKQKKHEPVSEMSNCVMFKFNVLDNNILVYDTNIAGQKCLTDLIGNYIESEDKLFVFLPDDGEDSFLVLMDRAVEIIHNGHYLNINDYPLPKWCLREDKKDDHESIKIVQVISNNKTCKMEFDVFGVEDCDWNCPINSYIKYPNNNKDVDEYYVFIDKKSVVTQKDTIGKALDIIKLETNKFPYVHLTKESMKVLDDLHKRGVVK